MHWMQRIHRPAARRRCIDEGHRLPSRDIAYRKRRVSILHNYAIPIRREVQERFSSASPTLDGSGCRSYLRLVYRGCDTAKVRKCVNVLSPITLWRRSGALKQAYPERSGSNTSALVPNVAHFKQTSRRSPGTPGLQERGTIWGWGILIVPMGNMIEIAFRELIQINGRALFLIVGCAMLMRS